MRDREREKERKKIDQTLTYLQDESYAIIFLFAHYPPPHFNRRDMLGAKKNQIAFILGRLARATIVCKVTGESTIGLW